jgi:hypothetical protein
VGTRDPGANFPTLPYVETRAPSCSQVSLVEPPSFSRFEFDQLQTEIFFIENMRLIAALFIFLQLL